MKTVFTTGEAAKLCRVSQQTIIRCFDSGQLKGFRVPGSRFRRIPRDNLYQFMTDNGIPTEDVFGKAKVRVLLIAGEGEAWFKELVPRLNQVKQLEVQCSGKAFEAGFAVKAFQPELVLLDTALPGLNGAAACQSLRLLEGQRRIICLCADDADVFRALCAAGADKVMEAPFEIDDLMACILEYAAPK